MAERIEEFRPNMAARDWAIVEQFVREAVADARPATTYSVKALLTAVSRLALWCHKSAGLPLERRTVFDRDVIAEYVRHGCPELTTRASRGTRRSMLLRVADSVLPPGERVTRLEPLSFSNPRQPYTLGEMVSLRSWAAGQVTEQRRADCASILALGLGAGLSAGEMLALRVGDIEVINPSDLYNSPEVLLHVSGTRARAVPVLGAWTPALLRLRSEVDPGRVALGPNRETMSPNWVSNFIFRTGGTLKPNTQRMRNTWLTHHITANTPLHPLLMAAGLSCSEVLDRLLRYIPCPTPEDVRAAFRTTDPGLRPVSTGSGV